MNGPAPLLPLFPLQTVLFPGALLPLRIFEARYMDLASRCLKENAVFGVNLIAEGSEVGTPARPHPVGVSARIVDWDMPQPGLLNVTTRGERRYRILRTETGTNGLLLGAVEWLAEVPAAATPEDCAPLVTLLRAIADDAGEARLPPPHDFGDAGWVGLRYAELLPIPVLAKQGLLELDDPLARLQLIRRYLEQRGLIN
jgi:Lon protease-like protein